MMDWNGDGRINSMDTYDMMHDTSNRSGSGGGVIGEFFKKLLIAGLILLVIGLINPILAKVLIIGYLVCKVAFP